MATLIAKLAVEFVGTFLLVVTIGCNQLGEDEVWGGVSVASYLMVMIYSFGGVSGANFNPAVSFAFGLKQAIGGNGMVWKEVAYYIVTQLVAGVLGGFFYYFLLGSAFWLGPTDAYAFTWVGTGMIELLYTFMLVFVILCVTSRPNKYFGLAIASVIIAANYSAGAISGAYHNPAVAIGVDFSSCVLGLGTSFWKGMGWSVVYVVFELLGAVAAVGAFRVIKSNEFGQVQDENTIAVKLLSEFVGTFMIMLTFGLNILGSSVALTLSVGASVTSMIYAFGDVSGAHFNPAISLAVGLSKNMTFKDVGSYAFIQVFASTFAAFCYSSFYADHVYDAVALSPLRPWFQVIVAESLFTFVLVSVYLSVATSEKTMTSLGDSFIQSVPKTISTTMLGLAVGSCISIGGMAASKISHGIMNPAIALGVGMHLITKGAGGEAMKVGVILAFGECIGAVAAVFFMKFTHSSEEESNIARDPEPLSSELVHSA